MTEEAWLTCTNLGQMLAWLKTSGRVSERKQYRLVVALRDSARETWSAIHEARFMEQCGEAAWSRWAAERGFGNARDITASIKQWEHARDVRLVRCVFGNPFRAVSVEPIWLTPTVLGLVQDAYKDWDRPYNYLNPARLVALATALEAAGCVEATLLAHLRESGPHVRGCRVLDLLLGKG